MKSETDPRPRAGDCLVLVGIALVPFAFFLSPHGPPSTTGHLSVLVLLLPILAGGLLLRGAPLPPAAVHAAGLLALLRLVSLPLSREPGIGLLEAERSILAAVAAWSAGRLTPAGRGLVEKIWIPVLLILAGWGLYQRFVLFPAILPRLSGEAAGRIASGRVFGPFALPALYSAVMAASFALFATQEGSPRRVPLAIAALAGLFLAGSASGPAALLLVLSLGVGRRARIAALGAAAVLAAVLILRRGEILDFFAAHNPVRLRLLIWNGSLRSYLDAPFLGHGTGAFLSAYPTHALPDAPLLTDPHNRIFRLLIENGPLAVLLYAAAVFPLLLSRTSFGKFGLVLLASSMLDITESDAGLGVLLFASAGGAAAEETAPPSRNTRFLSIAPLLGLLILAPLARFATAERAWADRPPAEPLAVGTEITLPSPGRIEAIRILRWDADRRVALARTLRLAPSGERPAMDLYEEALRLAPRRARFRAEYARLLAMRGRIEEARGQARRAEALAPFDPAVRAVVEEVRRPGP